MKETTEGTEMSSVFSKRKDYENVSTDRKNAESEEVDS